MRMRRLTSGPKPGGARCFVHFADVRAFDAQTVAYAVEARKIRRAFRRCNQIIRREAVVGRR